MASDQSHFGKVERDEGRDKLSQQVVKKQRSKTAATKKKNLSEGDSSSAAGGNGINKTRPKHEQKSAPSKNEWSSRPLSEYVIQEPIPDLNKLALDNNILHNIFKDIPEIDDN